MATFAPRFSRAGIVAIGCSTGGPNALAEVLPALPADFPAPVLVVQHMPPIFTSFLAQRLDQTCPLQVREAVAGEAIRPGTIWIAPGDFHLKIAGTAAEPLLSTDRGPALNSCRPSVDALFSSAGAVFGGDVLAVVMTGMGQDGLRGCQELKELGARILVQDEASSVVWGMPGFVARAHLADAILPVREIGGQIRRTVALHSPLRRATG
jgi:two-component system chemotaxis response regulator CheB